MLYYFNMSRVLAVPDVHGNKIVLENAKVAYEKHKPNFVVFVGDYVDSHVDGNSWIQQQEQLKAILDWKKELNKEKEICFTLFGNHDLSYMYNYGGVECSGHQFVKSNSTPARANSSASIGMSFKQLKLLRIGFSLMQVSLSNG